MVVWNFHSVPFAVDYGGLGNVTRNGEQSNGARVSVRHAGPCEQPFSSTDQFQSFPVVAHARLPETYELCLP